jgi:hypothetical protein
MTEYPAHRPGPGRVAAVIGAVFLLVVGVALVVGGAVLLGLFGRDGTVTAGKHPVTTTSAAVIADAGPIRDTSNVAQVLGTPTAMLTANGGNASGLFVGIGPATAVDSYLAGVTVDVAADFDVDPYVLTLTRHSGASPTASPPAAQTFWVASGSGPTVDLTWPVQDGDYRVVVMNADGAPVVNSQVSLGIGLSGMFGIALGMLIGGVVVILAAVALLVFTRPRRRPPVAPQAAPTPRPVAQPRP